MGQEDRELVELKIPQADLHRVMEVLSLLSQSQVSQDNQKKSLDLWLKSRALLADRQKRALIFGKAMFGEPPWELLLTLFASAESEGISVNALAERSGVPATSAKRWLDYLEQQGLIGRNDHSSDTRKTMVALTSKGIERMQTYLQTITLWG